MCEDYNYSFSLSGACICHMFLNSTLSYYMITIFKERHSGMDCRNPGSMDGFELTIHGTGYPLPGGYDGLAHNLTK